jgi:transmembrane sensor
MQFPERIWHLIARVLNNEASSTEREELMQLLSGDETLQQQYELLSRIWKERDHSVADEEYASNIIAKIIDRASMETEETERRSSRLRRRRRAYMAAAALILLVSGGWYYSHSNIKPAGNAKATPEALIVKKGSRSHSLLPDGTTVWLNAGSRLTYENDFTGATREVRLEGEAFFDVVKNPARPFIVHTTTIDIKVLGTAFNVKSYPEDKTVETTLYRGLVQVFRQDDPARTAIRLLPNQKLVLPKQAAKLMDEVSETKAPIIRALPARYTISPIDSTKQESERFETAWLYSRLEFRGDSFEDLAAKLERWYNVTILFTDEKVKQLNFNGSFENETIEQALTALREALPFNFKIIDHEISIGSSK